MTTSPQLQIRVATLDDLAVLDPIFESARQYMAAQGNAGQWVEGRPNSKSVRGNVESGEGRVVVLGDKVVGFFVVSTNEPAYEQIAENWSVSTPYIVVHRFAAYPGYKVGSFVFSYLQEQHDHIRVDTHRNNQTMQHLMDKFNFKYVGDVDYHMEPHDGIRMCFEWVRPQAG